MREVKRMQNPHEFPNSRSNPNAAATGDAEAQATAMLREMKPQDRKALQSLLNDPERLETVLRSPAAQALLRSLGAGK